jgi:hypothetical protein
MDAIGAKELQRRLEGHEQWCQAEAVRDGRQPAADPDLVELEEIGDRVRYYGHDHFHTKIDGRPARVTARMTKKLVDGAWETSLEQESVEFLDSAPARPLEAT